jgi:hypothetical protein
LGFPGGVEFKSDRSVKTHGRLILKVARRNSIEGQPWVAAHCTNALFSVLCNNGGTSFVAAVSLGPGGGRKRARPPQGDPSQRISALPSRANNPSSHSRQCAYNTHVSPKCTGRDDRRSARSFQLTPNALGRNCSLTSRAVANGRNCKGRSTLCTNSERCLLEAAYRITRNSNWCDKRRRLRCFTDLDGGRLHN